MIEGASIYTRNYGNPEKPNSWCLQTIQKPFSGNFQSEAVGAPADVQGPHKDLVNAQIKRKHSLQSRKPHTFVYSELFGTHQKLLFLLDPMKYLITTLELQASGHWETKIVLTSEICGKLEIYSFHTTCARCRKIVLVKGLGEILRSFGDLAMRILRSSYMLSGTVCSAIGVKWFPSLSSMYKIISFLVMLKGSYIKSH